jgi:hypothetical protein
MKKDEREGEETEREKETKEEYSKTSKLPVKNDGKPEVVNTVINESLSAEREQLILRIFRTCSLSALSDSNIIL